MRGLGPGEQHRAGRRQHGEEGRCCQGFGRSTIWVSRSIQLGRNTAVESQATHTHGRNVPLAARPARRRGPTAFPSASSGDHCRRAANGPVKCCRDRLWWGWD